MPKNAFYPIGSAGVPWTDEDKKTWLASNVKKRSYQEEVVSKLKALTNDFELIQYGELSINPKAYPLFALKTKNWQSSKPTILITGGVHGYETSGVHGAIQFLQQLEATYLSHFNIVTLPCVSPWGYEHIVRWNPYAIDPNRSFIKQSSSEEAQNAMQFIENLIQMGTPPKENKIILHIDLHETTDSDETEFQPALAARDGKNYIAGTIPDGFYVVGDTENKQTAFQSAIIKAVSKVTHIAPSDVKGEILGSKVEEAGVIYYSLKQLGLCAGMTDATYTTTTEVYPDSEKVTDSDCNNAQVAAIKAALDYIIQEKQTKI
jgi:hypothetical protein